MLQKHCKIWQSNTETKRIIFDKKEQKLYKPKENSKFQSFLNSFLADVLVFIAALITLIITLIIIYIVYRQSELKALVTNIAMQRIKAVEAADVSDMLCTCKTQWVHHGYVNNNHYRHTLFSY